uniref:Ubiquitin-like domain-containing protein n=1 Tax=Anopheles funestus TaxID=62324 RepID=A0A182RQB5_ANOFN
MSDIFGNLDNFLENYDENNISSSSNLSYTGSGIANDALVNDHSRRQSTNSATKSNKTTKSKRGTVPSQNNRNKTATTLGNLAVTTSTNSSVLTPSTPAPAPSVIDLTPTTLLSIADEMQLLFQSFQSIFNSKNPIVQEMLKNREASAIKRSFSTLNNSYNRKPPVTASEVMKLSKKIESVRNNLTQLDQKIKSTLEPVSPDQPSPSGRSRNTTAVNQLGPPNVISLDCDDDPVPMQTNALFGSRRVTRRSRASASTEGGSQSNVITLDSDEDSLPDCVGQQLNSSNRANNSFETENYIMRIKVKWRRGIEMFEHRRFQKFGDIIDQLAKKESADSTCIFLNLDDRIVYPNDTPDSINYKSNQFISGRILRTKAPDLPTALVPSSSNNNCITLKIQMETRKKPLRLQIDKHQTMSVLVIKCAEELKCEPKDIKMYFDGELVDNSSKPEDLDLEGEEILDIRFSK